MLSGKKEIEAGANPNLKWCRLIDSKIQLTNGLSMSCLVIPVNGELPLHRHTPQEIYLIKSGHGLLLLDNSETKAIFENDVIYISENEIHGLKNQGETQLEIFWIFPTNSWDNVEYNYQLK